MDVDHEAVLASCREQLIELRLARRVGGMAAEQKARLQHGYAFFGGQFERLGVPVGVRRFRRDPRAAADPVAVAVRGLEGEVVEAEGDIRVRNAVVRENQGLLDAVGVEISDQFGDRVLGGHVRADRRAAVSSVLHGNRRRGPGFGYA